MSKFEIKVIYDDNIQDILTAATSLSDEQIDSWIADIAEEVYHTKKYKWKKIRELGCASYAILNEEYHVSLN